ncbi:MAG: ferredoxin, partial [Halobacteriota archaeon]
MPTVEYLNYEVLEDLGWDIEDDDLFEKAADEDLDDEDYGT